MPVPDPLQKVLQEPGNSFCADCNTRNPKWASINLGIFICENCAGIHRNLGTHITQVRSVKLDTWKPPWIEVMSSVGNAKAKAYYEGNVPDSERFKGCTAQVGGDRLDNEDAKRLETWIRAKYEEKRYVIPGSSLDTALAAAPSRPADSGGGGSNSTTQKQSASSDPWGSAASWQSQAPSFQGDGGQAVWGAPAQSGDSGLAGWGASAGGTGAWPSQQTSDRPNAAWSSSGNSTAWESQPKVDDTPSGDPWGSSASSAAWTAQPSQGEIPHKEVEKDKDKKTKRSHRKHASMSTVEAGGWAVDAARLKQYKDGFVWADTDRNGLISMAEAKEFLQTSGLPSRELCQIWKMSDVGKDSMLSLGEFICAMHLTFRRWQGVPLPPSLPNELLTIVNDMSKTQRTAVAPQPSVGGNPFACR